MSRVLAITREVSRSLERCELTHVARAPIDVARARRQHAAYVGALEAGGCEVVRLPEAPELPDSVFVEDTAVVVDELAVITRPGAASRRREVHAVATALAPLRELRFVDPPGTLDGGDVLRLGRRVLVGLSHRTNPEGLRQLAGHLLPLGYEVQGVAVDACLHLKSAVTEAAADTVLLNPGWIDPRTLGDVEMIEVDPTEPMAANCLRLGDRVLCAAAFPRTRERLERCGIEVVAVDVDELAKAEGAVTCCSIVLAVE